MTEQRPLCLRRLTVAWLLEGAAVRDRGWTEMTTQSVPKVDSTLGTRQHCTVLIQLRQRCGSKSKQIGLCAISTGDIIMQI